MRSRLISMLLTGLVLAILFLAAVQVTQTVRSRFFSGGTVSPGTNEASELPDSYLPVIIQSVSENDASMFISGTSEPNSAIRIQNFGNDISQVQSNEAGEWTVNFDINMEEMLKIEMVEFVQGDKSIRSDEAIHRVPPPALDEVSEDQSPRALVMVTAPGGPSSIFQSPFRGLPTSDGISMGSIDYDESGGVIFSGTSTVDGRVRIYANNTVIGERRVAANGRWYIIAADTLPRGSFDIRAEVINEAGIHSKISVPFERLTQNDSKSESDIEVFYQPYGWQIRRALIGGGNQYTAIFAPEDADAIIQE